MNAPTKKCPNCGSNPSRAVDKPLCQPCVDSFPGPAPALEQMEALFQRIMGDGVRPVDYGEKP